MSARRTVEIVAVHGCPPCAVLGSFTAAPEAQTAAWAGDFRTLAAFQAAMRLLPEGAVFDAELTRRWKRLVGCTPEFSLYYRSAGADEHPRATFVLEVLE